MTSVSLGGSIARANQQPAQPGVEPIRITQAAEVLPGLDQRVLDGVLRSLGVAQDQAGNRKQATRAARRQRRERLQIAVPGSDHEVAFDRSTLVHRGRSRPRPSLGRRSAICSDFLAQCPRGDPRDPLRAERRGQRRVPDLRVRADRPRRRSRQPVGPGLGLGPAAVRAPRRGPRVIRARHDVRQARDGPVRPSSATSRRSRRGWTTSAPSWTTPASSARRSSRPTRACGSRSSSRRPTRSGPSR